MDRAPGPTFSECRGARWLRPLFRGLHRLVGVVSVLLAVPSASAACYFVRDGGEDVADVLAEATARAGIARVNGRTFATGDVIWSKHGSSWAGTRPIASASWATGNPITFGADGPVTEVQPVSSVSGGTGFQANDHNHITVADLEFRNAKNGLDADPRFVVLAGSDFSLQSGATPSPALNHRAIVMLTQSLGLQHEPVPRGGAPEIGADEVPASLGGGAEAAAKK